MIKQEAFCALGQEGDLGIVCVLEAKTLGSGGDEGDLGRRRNQEDVS